MDGEPRGRFADRIHEVDVATLNIEIGSAEGQQVLECLVGLAALRVWKDLWLSRRASVSFRGDNVTLLTMVSRLSGLSPGVNAVTREAALLFAEANYRPVGAEHSLGVANAIADALSRRFQHGVDSNWLPPAALREISETVLPRRDASWYLAAN